MNQNGSKHHSAPLHTLVNIKGGGTPSKRIPEYYGGDIPWVTPKDMKSWYIDDSEDHITMEAIASSSTTLIAPNAVLVCIRSGVLAHTLPVAINRVPVTMNQDMKALRCCQRLHPPYLARFLKSYSPRLLQTVRGTTAHNLSMDVVKQIEIPLPPLPEQKRIADILDKADAIRRKREEAIDCLGEIPASTFIEMFGDPRTNPKKLPMKCLADLVQRPITYGILKPGPHVASGVAMLRIQDIRGNWIDDSDLHYVSDQLSLQYKRTILAGGEIVISLVGTIGLVAVVPPSLAGANVHRNLGVIVPGPEMHQEFLYYLLSSPLFPELLKSVVKGGNQALLNLGDLGKLNIPVPPIKNQLEFARRMTKLQELRCSLKQFRSGATDFFNALVQRAFKGKL